MMQKLRWRITVTVGWLFAMYNVERLLEPINIASFVYILTAMLAAGVLAIRPLRNIALPRILAGSFVLLLALKATLGYRILGPALPLTVTELCAVAVTVWLARRITESTYEFENSVTDVITLHLDEQLCRFDHAQGEMYREVRRARHFERPLAIVSVEPTRASLAVSVGHLIEEVQQETIRKYVQARMSELLVRETNDCGVIAHRGDRFFILLPESDRGRAERVLANIAAALSRDLDLKVRTGVATFPDEETTLSGLIERAQSQLKDTAKAMDAQPTDESLPLVLGVCSGAVGGSAAEFRVSS
jgi:hypothetical protein